MKREQANRDPDARLRWSLVLLITALFVPTGLVGQEKRSEDVSELRKKADDIRASADKLFKLQRIPWITDPAEGFRLAKEENRPVFLYLQVGDPLGDC